MVVVCADVSDCVVVVVSAGFGVNVDSVVVAAAVVGKAVEDCVVGVVCVVVVVCDVEVCVVVCGDAEDPDGAMGVDAVKAGRVVVPVLVPHLGLATSYG